MQPRSDIPTQPLTCAWEEMEAGCLLKWSEDLLLHLWVTAGHLPKPAGSSAAAGNVHHARYTRETTEKYLCSTGRYIQKSVLTLGYIVWYISVPFVFFRLFIGPQQVWCSTKASFYITLFGLSQNCFSVAPQPLIFENLI